MMLEASQMRGMDVVDVNLLRILLFSVKIDLRSYITRVNMFCPWLLFIKDYVSHIFDF